MSIIWDIGLQNKKEEGCLLLKRSTWFAKVGVVLGCIGVLTPELDLTLKTRVYREENPHINYCIKLHQGRNLRDIR